MWNVLLGLNLITGAGGVATRRRGQIDGPRPRDRLREQIEREEHEMFQLANELITRI